MKHAGSKQIIVVLVVLVVLLAVTCHRAEGLCSVEHCANSTTCVMSKDQRSCKCTTGYYGDLCNKDAGITVLCGSDYIGIRALEDFFKYHNVALESLHLPNTSCRAEKTIIDGRVYYISRISKEEYIPCGGKPFEKNFTHITYSLSLISDPQVIGNIIRDPVIQLDYRCVSPYVRRVSLPFPVVPYSTETVMRVDDLDATIQMMLYTDHTYTKAYTSAPSIELRDKVFVEVTVTEPADFFLLHLSKCWATQYSQPNTTVGSHHILLQNGCVGDDTVSFINASVSKFGRNGESSTVRYSFDMFRFTTEPYELFLHCTVQLCEPDDHESCKPNCNSISKREAVRADPAQGLLSYGPIRIEMPTTSHSSVLATVVLPVAAVWTVGFFLIILITVAKAGSRRLIQVEAQ